MLLDPALACPSVSQKSTQCRLAAVPMDFPLHPQRSHVIAKDCASVCSRFRAPLALAVATGAPQSPHWKRNTCTKGSSPPCNVILPRAGLERPDRPTLAAAASEIHTSNGRIPLTKDPKENGYKPLPRRGDAPRFRWGKKLIASATRSATTPHRHSERSEESLCGFWVAQPLLAVLRRPKLSSRGA